jgi:hypothetical protein
MMSTIVYQELRVYKDSYYNGSEGVTAMQERTWRDGVVTSRMTPEDDG